MAETTTEMLTPGGGVTETSLHWADYIVIVLYFLAVLVVSSLEETSTFYIYTNIRHSKYEILSKLVYWTILNISVSDFNFG